MATKKLSIDLAIETANAAGSLREVKKSLKELTDIQLQYGEGSEEFTKAAEKAGQLKDRINAAKDSLRNLSNSPIENLKNSTGLLVQQIKNLDFSGAKQSLKDLGTSGKALLGIEKGAKAGTIAMRGLGAAVAATGIGALVAIIAVVIDQFDEIKASGGALGNVFNFIGDTIEFVKTKIIDLLDAFGLVDGAALKAAAAQEKANKKAEESLDKLNLAYSLNADKYAESTQKKFQADLDYKKAVLDINKNEKLSAEEKEKFIAAAYEQRVRKIKDVDEQRRVANEENAKKEVEKQKADDQKAIETQKKKQQDAENQRKTLSELNIKLIQDENAKELATLDEKYKQDQFAFKNNKEVLKKLEEVYLVERAKLIENQEKKDKEKADEKKKKEEQEAIDKAQKEVDRLNQITEANTLAEEQLIANKDRELQLEQQYNVSQQQIEDLYAAEKQRRLDQNLKTEDDLVYASIQRQLQAEEDSKNRKAQLTALVVQAVQNSLTTINNLAELFAGKSRKQQERAFKVQKAVSIAQTLISTFQSAQSSYKALAGIVPIGPILGGIAAAAAVTAGLVNVKKIKEQKFSPDGGASGSASAGGSAPPAISTTTISSASSGLSSGIASALPAPATVAPQFFGTSGAFSGNQPQPVRAFVVESELTDAQLRAELLRRRTTL